jgi:hypothetical protein
MASAIQSARSPRGRRFAVEPLEDRSLLSGIVTQSPPGADAAAPPADQSTSETVEVVEIAPADSDDSASDDSREIGVEALPRPVVAAMSDRFPGARLVAAELDDEDGSFVFELSAEWRGIAIEVELSPNGDVLQFGQTVEAADLPQTVREWIAGNFPGALVQEVERVTAGDRVTYELVFETSAEQTFEAVLRVPASTSGVELLPSASGDSAVLASGLLDAFIFGLSDHAVKRGDMRDATEDRFAPAETASRPVLFVADPAVMETGLQVTQRGPADQPTESDGESQGASVTDSDQIAGLAGPVATGRVNGSGMRPFAFSQPLRPVVSTIATAVPAAWIPQVAQVLVNVFPMDATVLEQSLRQFLDEIDSLADDVASTSLVNRLTPKLLLAAATLAGAERLITQMNKTRRDPVLTSAGGKSTWTWVLNLTDTLTPGPSPRKRGEGRR